MVSPPPEQAPPSSPSLPALLGGAPVRPSGPPTWPLPDPDVQAALTAAIEAGVWGQYHGDHVCALEAELAALHNLPHALTCASGTLAVEVALRALRVSPGDDVILAAYEYESNFLTVHALGAKPVLVDIAPQNGNLDPAGLTAAFSPSTKAIICSHLHGGIVPMREVTALARARGVGVVEDAAQAPGAIVQGRPAGTWGDVGALSFGGSKLLTAGRGGAILTRDPQLAQRARVWLHRGMQQWAPLSELQAAAIRPQLAKLADATTHRHRQVLHLAAAIDRSGVQGLSLFANEATDSIPGYYKVGLRFDPTAFGLSRDLFVRALRAEGVAFDAGFNALHVNRSSSRFRAVGPLDHATAFHTQCVILHHPILSGPSEDAQQVADAIAKVYHHRLSFR